MSGLIVASPAESQYFGVDAQALPGPEILHQLNPDALLNNRPSILKVPGRADCIVRIYPKGGTTYTPAQREKLDWINQRQVEHANALVDGSERTIAMPASRSFVSHLPDSLRHQKNGILRGEFALVSVVRRVKGAPIEGRDCYSDPRGVNFVYGLAKYLEWLLSNNRGEMYSDIFDPSQVRGRYIVDNEPALCALRPKRFSKRVKALNDWHTELGLYSSHSLMARAGELLSRLNLCSQAIQAADKAAGACGLQWQSLQNSEKYLLD